MDIYHIFGIRLVSNQLCAISLLHMARQSGYVWLAWDWYLIWLDVYWIMVLIIMAGIILWLILLQLRVSEPAGRLASHVLVSHRLISWLAGYWIYWLDYVLRFKSNWVILLLICYMSWIFRYSIKNFAGEKSGIIFLFSWLLGMW